MKLLRNTAALVSVLGLVMLLVSASWNPYTGEGNPSLAIAISGLLICMVGQLLAASAEIGRHER